MRQAWIISFATLMLWMPARLQAADGGKAIATGPAGENSFTLLRPDEMGLYPSPTLMDREILRQSMLLTAQDRLGLWTHDEVMEDITATGNKNEPERQGQLMVCLPGGMLSIQFTCGNYRSLQFDLQLDRLNQTTNQDFLKMAQELSHVEFPNWLKAAGFTGEPHGNGNMSLPDEVANRLREITIFSQFAAVQQIHAVIRKHGDSPQLIEGLVLGYANLSQLTRHQWPATTYAFAARSLLYAQRLVEDDPSPKALWYRAYAEAMTGFHGDAMKDLQAAGDDRSAAPAWVSMIDPLCRLDFRALEDLARRDPQNAGLAMFLAYLATENCGSQSVVMETGKLVLKTNPECDRVRDSLCNYAGFDYLNRLTQDAFSAEVQTLGAELPRIRNLPEKVQRAWNAAHTNPDLMADVAHVSAAFADTQDASEPSWGVLGHLLQEGDFIRVYRRTYFMAFDWHVDTLDFVHQSAPLVKGHSYLPFINAMLAYQRDQQIPDDFSRMTIFDLRPGMNMSGKMPFTWLDDRRPHDYASFSNKQRHNSDRNAWDLADLLQFEIDQNNQGMYAACGLVLQKVAPTSPLGAASRVHSDEFEDDIDSHLDEWTREFSGYPAFDRNVAIWYIRKNQNDKAISSLKAFLKIGTDYDVYRMLAECYLRQNDEAQWFSTLQESLAQQDYGGFDHATVKFEIASHFMEAGKYTDAKPYADAAGDSGTRWGLDCSARCRLGLKDYNAAAQIAQKLSDNYDDPTDWYFICRTTGHGDLDAARRAMTAWASGDRDIRELADFYAGEKDFKSAIGALKKNADQGDPICGIWLAMIYDATGDKESRDAAISVVMEKGPWFKPADGQSPAPGATLARLLQKAWASGDQLDLKTVEYMCQRHTPADAAPIAYFAGEYLRNHQDEQHGIEWIERSVKMAPFNSSIGRLARMELHDDGIDPYDLP